MEKLGKKVLGRLGVAIALASVLVVVSCADDDGDGGSKPTASFTTTIEGLSVTVENTSTGADSYSWDFGDGSAALTIEEGTYTYAEGGTYVITLTATNDNGSSTAEESVTVEAPCDADNTTAGSIDLQFAVLADDGADNGDGGYLAHFDGFDGVEFSVIANPDASGINTSCQVAQWLFAGGEGCQSWAGAGMNLGAGNELNFDSQNTSFEVMVWGAAGTTVELVLERNPFPDTTPSQSSAVKTISTADTWEKLTFDFTAVDNGNNSDGSATADGVTDTYQNIIMYVNRGAECSTAPKTFYIDNFKQVATAQ